MTVFNPTVKPEFPLVEVWLHDVGKKIPDVEAILSESVSRLFSREEKSYNTQILSLIS